MRFGIGVVEGFYGAPWPHAERLAAFRFLAAAGYTSYLYAPKADRALRAEWRQPLAAAWLDRLHQMVDACHAEGMHFGIGVSPLGAERDPAAARQHLLARAAELSAVGVDLFAVLFDDVPAATPVPVEVQVDLVRALRRSSAGPELLMCPVWYSDDPWLAEYSGPCPEGYLETLGESLDESVGVFWTGPKVCTREWTAAHLVDIGARLGRPPVLWDNYPVNDGPHMCRSLHLGAFSGRGAAVAERCDGVFANPMNQCALSLPVLLTLPWNLWQPNYDPVAATRAAFRRALPAALEKRLARDWQRFAAPGLAGMADEERRALAGEYAAIEHPAAAEVVAWLRGETIVGDEVLVP